MVTKSTNPNDTGSIICSTSLPVMILGKIERLGDNSMLIRR